MTSQPAFESLQLELDDGIAVVSLNRPQKRNAISFAMLRELLACARYLRSNRAVRAVVIRGAGESFSSGIDLADLGDPRNRWFGVWQLLKPGRNLFQQANLVWQQLPVPVIAVLHGHCLGAGLQLALAADQRISTPDCQLAIREGHWGLVPDMGLTRSLRGLVRLDVAKELTFSARIIDGKQAHALGLVTHLHDDPLVAAMALAREYATRSPDAVLAAKRVLDAMVHAPWRSLRTEKWWQLKLMRGRNFRIALSRPKAPDRPFEPRQYR